MATSVTPSPAGLPSGRPSEAVRRRWHRALATAGESVRVVLPEGGDVRIREAADRLAAEGLVRPVLVCPTPGDVRRAAAAGVEATTADALADGAPGARLAEIGAGRGWADDVVAARRRDPLHLAAAMVAGGEADTCVAGSAHASGDVIRAALRVLGLAPGVDLLSSSFLLVLPSGRTLGFGDCAVVPRPDERQLAQIAVATARTYAALTGAEPEVAMLSSSTLGSADHEEARRVRAATGLVRELAPDLAVDGEMQFDAAIVESVAAQKAGGSAVAGRANVVVFPDLASGNIGYKIAQRLGGAEAFGPILQGLGAPMNDLSRGCSVEDVVNVATLSAVQALASRDRRAADPVLDPVLDPALDPA